MSKPALTIITTPASAPATEPSSPAFGEETPSTRTDHLHGSHQSTLESSDNIVETEAQESPVTDEVVGTPSLAHDARNIHMTLAEQEEARKVKAWSSNISTSESVPVGLRLPPIPDEATLRNLAAARSRSTSGSRSPTAGSVGRLAMGKGEATRSLPSLKDTANQQFKQDQAARGRSPLAQANTSGPVVSPRPAPIKPSTGFKAFIKRTFGIGKSSNDQQKQRERTQSPASPAYQIRTEQSSVQSTRLTAEPTPNPVPVVPFVKVSATRSPSTLATPVFSSVSNPNPTSATNGGPPDSTMAPPRSPADVPLPPSPLILQDSPHIPTLTRFPSGIVPRLYEVGPRRPSMESRNTERSELTAITTADPEVTLGGVSLSGPTDSVGNMLGYCGTDCNSSEATRVERTNCPSLPDRPSEGLSEDGGTQDRQLDTAQSSARPSSGRAGLTRSPSKIVSAIEPQQAPPFATSPVNSSHVNAGQQTAVKTAELHGGVTMSRSVTAEGMKEAEEIMGGKQLVLQEASEKLAALAAAQSRRSIDDSEEEEAKDSLGSDLGFRSRAAQQTRRVSPTSNGISKYGRGISVPGGERLSPASADVLTSDKDGFGRKASVRTGAGLTRSGSRLRTSVYGLADVLHRKDTTPRQKRISLSPTMHTMGTIMNEANEIMDQDERDRAESFFMS